MREIGKMNFTFYEAKIDSGWLCLKIKERALAREFVLKKQDGLYDCKVFPHRKRRSLDANAYYWKLCGELAKAIHETPQNIYRRHISEIGNYEILCMESLAVADFSRRWCSDHIGRFCETRESKLPGCTTVLAYYGSSDFDSGEMSKLIDNCIQDCKAVGVETLPPDKIQLLKEEWGNAPAN